MLRRDDERRGLEGAGIGSGEDTKGQRYDSWVLLVLLLSRAAVVVRLCGGKGVVAVAAVGAGAKVNGHKRLGSCFTSSLTVVGCPSLVAVVVVVSAPKGF